MTRFSAIRFQSFLNYRLISSDPTTPAMKKPKPNLDPRQEQSDKLKELGLHLHQVRLEKGISLEAVAETTKIQPRLLRAIEAGDLEELPEPVYIRGLLKQFANHLGLDGAEIAEAFPMELGWQQRQFIPFKLPLIQFRPLHLYLVYVVIVGLSVKGLANLLQPAVQERSEQPQIIIIDESPSNQDTVQTVDQTLPPEPEPAKPVKPVVVSIQLKDQCWMRVDVDGKTEFEGTLPAGTQRTWTADQQITLLAGNAGGVVVSFNDQQAEQLGSPGQVEEVTYQATPTSTQ